MNVGQRIKERRLELEMSMEQLANKLGINRSTVYRYETGEIEKMPIGVIKPIAEALQTTPAHLLGWDQEEINEVAQIQEDAAEYTVSTEGILQNFMIEISEMGFDSSEIDLIRKYAHVVRELGIKNSFEFNKAFSNLFLEMYKLELSLEDLKEIYTYAQFLKSKQK